MAVGTLTGGCASATATSGGPALLPRAEEMALVSPATGRVLTPAEVRAQAPAAVLGDAVYAEVNSAWLRAWYARFHAELLRLGVARWDGRFDCNRFAEMYTGLAQVSFLRATGQESSAARALALGPFWYIRADGDAHAIVQALTERGRIFIDPQTGREVALTTRERKSAYLQVF